MLLCIFYNTTAQVRNTTSGVYNILDFGAVNDSTVLSTDAINRAIETCFENGGGRVSVPAGKFLSGTIILKNNVELHLMPGSYLYASKQIADFPKQQQPGYRSLKDAGGWYSLIYAEGANNISITGSGVIDGRGRGRKGVPGGKGGDMDGRPRNILFISCTNVTVSGVSMFNAAIWNQHYLNCEDVTVSGIRVFNHCNGNNDGIDIDGCRRFILANSIIDSDDDGIVLKSTGPAACENITITNCIVSSFANAIKCGTESTGGFKNIVISNCVVKPSRNKEKSFVRFSHSGITGISLEIVDGGIMDGVSIDNIVIEGTECPLYVRLGNRARKYKEDMEVPVVGTMRNIQISNVMAYQTGNFSSSITGIGSKKIENIYLNNIRFFNKGGLQSGNFRKPRENESANHDKVSDSLMNWQYLSSYNEVTEDEKGYPQPTIWRNLPSYGLFIRHVEQVFLQNASFIPSAEDPRIPLIAVDVDLLMLQNIQTGKMSAGMDVLLHKVQKIKAGKETKIKKRSIK
ncbi:MAG: glycosyl hydrolase family 28 protein [Lacibacter sp.]